MKNGQINSGNDCLGPEGFPSSDLSKHGSQIVFFASSLVASKMHQEFTVLDVIIALSMASFLLEDADSPIGHVGYPLRFWNVYPQP